MLIPLALALYQKDALKVSLDRLMDGTYEGQAIDRMKTAIGTNSEGKSFPQMYGVSSGQAMSVLGHYGDLLNADKINPWWNLSVSEKARLAEIIGTEVFKGDSNSKKKALWVLMSLQKIGPDDGEIYDYFSGNVSRSTIEKNARYSELINTASDFVSVPGKVFAHSAKKAGDEIEKLNLPFFLNPKYIALTAAGGAGLYFYFTVLRPILKAKKKVFKNPSAQKIYEQFNSSHVDLSYPVLVPDDLDNPEDLAYLGDVESIQYSSKKWDGEERSYKHDFENTPQLLASADGSTMLINGMQRITARGIEG